MTVVCCWRQQRRGFIWLARCLFLGLLSALLAAEDAPVALLPAATNAVTHLTDELLRSQLQLQEQLHSLQMRWERSQQDAEAAAARSSELITDRLRTIESSLDAQRAKELETIQSSNRTLLLVAGGFAAVGFMTMLVMAFLQWRALNRWAGMASAVPHGHLLGHGSALPALNGVDPRLLNPSPQVEQSNLRLAEALSRLEKNLLQLNAAAEARPAAHDESSSLAKAGEAESASRANGSPPEFSVLLGKGQSLLNMDKVDEALTCFDQALQLQPDHGEALIKRGMALERLGKLDEALTCYDKALGTNPRLTVAYLHKGGLYNRMERFAEALECYEQALRHG